MSTKASKNSFLTFNNGSKMRKKYLCSISVSHLRFYLAVPFSARLPFSCSVFSRLYVLWRISLISKYETSNLKLFTGVVCTLRNVRISLVKFILQNSCMHFLLVLDIIIELWICNLHEMKSTFLDFSILNSLQQTFSLQKLNSINDKKCMK